MTTDLEAHGLSTGQLSPVGRNIVLTVDFEAFEVTSLSLWTSAMSYWARRAEELGLRFTYFLAIEDVVRLRAQTGPGYRSFLDCLGALEGAGGSIHPHNHRVFDPRSGLTSTPQGKVAQRAPDYPRRASMFYDVVHRHGLDWASWMAQVTDSYVALIADAGLMLPQRLAFRPGGWDHGATREDVERYVEGVSRAGYSIDSSATAGTFGEPSWRVGAPAGSNVYGLGSSLVEVAPCSSMDCGAGLLARGNLSFLAGIVKQDAMWRPPFRPVAFVIVLHLDHLFHELVGGTRRLFSVVDERVVRRRVDRAFRQLLLIRSALRLGSALLTDVVPLDETRRLAASGRQDQPAGPRTRSKP